MENDADVIRVAFAYTFEDVRDARKLILHGMSGKARKSGWRFLGWAVVIVAGAGMLWIFRAPGKVEMNWGEWRERFWRWSLTNVWVYVGVVAGGFWMWRWRKTGRRAFVQAGPQEMQTVTVSHGGIGWEKATFRTDFQWGHFSRVEEGETVFALCHGKGLAVIFPKRVMSEEEVGKLRGILFASVGKAKGFEVVMGEKGSSS